MKRALEEGLRALAERIPEGGVALAWATANGIEPRALLDAPVGGDNAEILLWDPPAAEAGGGRSVAGRGRALAVEGDGLATADLVTRIERAFRAIAMPEGAPTPRFYGGVAFRPTGRAAPWADFADASFALPRWQCAAIDGETRIGLAVGKREIGSAALAREIEDVARHLGSPPAARPAAFAPASSASGMSRDAWAELVGDALSRIRGREVEKLVAARPIRLAVAHADAALVVERLRARTATSGGATTLFAFGRGASVFVGATPERLVAKRGLAITTEALAGTRPRRGDGAAALLASDKDWREHALVVRGIRAALEPLCEELAVPAEPEVRSLRDVCHLATPIAGRLRAPANVLEVALALHPTPAVGGWPKGRAIDWIAAHEDVPRGWYAAPIGWVDAAGDGAFAVAIRSALIGAGRAWVFAGAGIVEGSDAGLEYAEIELKQAAMLSALGAA